MAVIVDEVQIGSNQIQPERLPRPVISTLDTWDMSTQVDYPYAHAGRRPGWNIPSIAVTSETVNTIRSSSATRFVSQSVPTQATMLKNPVTASLAYKPVPNMAQVIRTDSSVQISFSLVVMVTVVQAPYFAVFRDRVKISQDYRSSGTAVNVPFMVTGAYVDTRPAMGFHVYDLRWHVDPAIHGQITAVGTNRTFQASNLRAQ